MPNQNSTPEAPHGELACADVEAILGEAQTELTRVNALNVELTATNAALRARKTCAEGEVRASRDAGLVPTDALASVFLDTEVIREAYQFNGRTGEPTPEFIAQVQAHIQDAAEAARGAAITQLALSVDR